MEDCLVVCCFCSHVKRSCQWQTAVCLEVTNSETLLRWNRELWGIHCYKHKSNYGGKKYFHYINMSLAITVFIHENASLLDGCRRLYSLFCSLSSSSLSIFFVSQSLLWTIDMAATMWDLITGVIFCFLPLPCLGKAQLSYSTLYSALKFVVGGKSLWDNTFEYQVWLVSQPLWLCVVGVENLLNCTVQN